MSHSGWTEANEIKFNIDRIKISLDEEKKRARVCIVYSRGSAGVSPAV